MWVWYDKGFLYKNFFNMIRVCVCTKLYKVYSWQASTTICFSDTFQDKTFLTWGQTKASLEQRIKYYMYYVEYKTENCYWDDAVLGSEKQLRKAVIKERTDRVISRRSSAPRKKYGIFRFLCFVLFVIILILCNLYSLAEALVFNHPLFICTTDGLKGEFWVLWRGDAGSWKWSCN